MFHGIWSCWGQDLYFSLWWLEKAQQGSICICMPMALHLQQMQWTTTSIEVGLMSQFPQHSKRQQLSAMKSQVYNEEGTVRCAWVTKHYAGLRHPDSSEPDREGLEVKSCLQESINEPPTIASAQARHPRACNTASAQTGIASAGGVDPRLQASWTCQPAIAPACQYDEGMGQQRTR